MELIGRSELRIEAPLDGVWACLLAVDRWRAWMPGVQWAVLEGEPGSRHGYVTIKPERGRQTAYRVTISDQPRALALSLTFGPLATLRRTWMLDPDGDATRVASIVEVGGPLRTRLVRGAAVRAHAAAPALLAALAEHLGR